MKSKALLESFTAYCRANPEQRFWQALRNWAGWPFVIVAQDFYWPAGAAEAIASKAQDTFYWEEMNGVSSRK